MDCLQQRRVSILNLRINDQDIMHIFTGNVQSDPLSGYNRQIEEDYDLIESPSSGQREEKQLSPVFLILGPIVVLILVLLAPVLTLIAPLVIPVLVGLFGFSSG